jgi:hypothetical protein
MTTIPETKPSSLPEFSEVIKEVVDTPKIDETPQEDETSLDDVLTNHEVRLNAIEAALLRIRGAI